MLIEQMSGRTLVLILSLWAVLTIVTPILVRLSASATPKGEFFVITHTTASKGFFSFFTKLNKEAKI